MKISKTILATVICIGIVACHEVEVPAGPSMTEFLTAQAWAQHSADLDDEDIHESGWVIRFNADGSFDDKGLHIDPAGGPATWSWNSAETSITITQGGDKVAQLNVVELSTGTFIYDQFVSFPNIDGDHIVYYNSPVCDNAIDWSGDFAALENTYDGAIVDDHYGPYDVTLVMDPTNPNKFSFDNFFDSGIDAYMIFDPATMKVSFPTQDDGSGTPISGVGTYDACTGSFVIRTAYDGDEWNYVFVKQ
jgi:hypothetical protein